MNKTNLFYAFITLCTTLAAIWSIWDAVSTLWDLKALCSVLLFALWCFGCLFSVAGEEQQKLKIEIKRLEGVINRANHYRRE